MDKGIANRTIGQSLRVDFPKSKPSLYNQQTKRRNLKTLIYWLEFQFGIRMDLSIGRAALLHWIQRGSLSIEVCGMLSLPLVSAAQPVVASANNHWPLDEMLPVQQGGLPKGVSRELQMVSR